MSAVAAFISALPEAERAAAQDEAAHIAARLEEARAAWPALALDGEAFARYLAARLPPDWREALEVWHVGDLYLACGCAGHDRAATQELEVRFIALTPAFLSGFEGGASFVDEVKQLLRTHLLVDGTHIGEYSGRGPLLAWLRVTAQRIGLNLLRSRKPAAELDDEDLGVALADPELDYLKESAGRELAAALRAALAECSVRERNLLRLHFLDGLGTPEIASLLRTHRTTVRRKLNDLQVELLARVRRQLQARLKLGDSEVESLMRAARSRLQLSIRQLLK